MGFLGALKGLGGAMAGATPGLGALANSKVGKVAMPGVGKMLGGPKPPAVGGALGSTPLGVGAKPVGFAAGAAGDPAMQPRLLTRQTPQQQKSVSKGRSLRGGKR